MARSGELPEQWHAFVRGLVRLYEETGLLLTDEHDELYAPKVIKGEHFFPMPIWQASDPDDPASVAGEYLSPSEIDRREEEARRKAEDESECLEFERLKNKFERSKP